MDSILTRTFWDTDPPASPERANRINLRAARDGGQVNTDGHGLKIFISPAARENFLQTDTVVFKASLPPIGGYK